MTIAEKQVYYQALLGKKTEYEGVFFVGVTTTGVFCRPTCPARKPKFENCQFFKTVQQALLASFRACKRCQSLSHPGHTSEVVQMLVNAVERNPEKRWRDSDIRALSVDASTARRQFKKRFGMTFVAYARALRMGLAMKEFRAGQTVIDAQVAAGYESGSGFRDAFSRIMGPAPALKNHHNILKAAWLDSPLGPVLAIADEKELHLLEFVDRRRLEREVERLRKKSAIVPARTAPIELIERELEQYFSGSLKEFKTPFVLQGSPFQKQVWEALRRIPSGQTRSYSQLAKEIGRPTAFRAVANANGANQLALIIPCHRVINSNGDLGGYGGGISRKKWLLEHEKKYFF
jgi:AraC family transcriptional regulator, regulatory protein of adaptative response / methylated-DNA-[protein]-cysteine methyltransferase